MPKKEKKQIEADRLIEMYCMSIYGLPTNEVAKPQEAIESAINDVSNTIEVLERIPDIEERDSVLLYEYDFYHQVKHILEVTLK